MNRQVFCDVLLWDDSVAWGHIITLWDPSLEKSIPALISVFCGAEIKAVKWQFIRVELVVVVGLSWDKPTAGQVRSGSLSNMANTRTGMICRPNPSIWSPMERGVRTQGRGLLWSIHPLLLCSLFFFSMRKKFWDRKDTVCFIVQWTLIWKDNGVLRVFRQTF